jgi:DNA-directed RNA polymerase specialized sigma24 family protein
MNEMTDQDWKNLLASIIRFVKSKGGTPDDGRDILQDAIEATLNNIAKGRYNEQGKIGGYIAQIARKKWHDKMRKGTTMLGEEYLPSVVDEQYEYDNSLRRADETGVDLRLLISNNPKILHRFEVYNAWEDTECQKRLERAYIEDLSNIEQAELENIRVNTFTVRLKRCRDNFVEMYNKLVAEKR